MGNRATTPCAICETRRPRRHCPGIRSEICSPCCGSSREITIDCPLECPHLQEAHRFERVPEPDIGKLPNSDVELTEAFLARNSHLFDFLCRSLLRHAQISPGIVDNDVKDALESMARTYRTLQSGLYYETRPSNLYAAQLQQSLRQDLDAWLQQERQRAGIDVVRDADVLGILVMLQRIEFTRNNGRPRGRAFLGFLRQQFPESRPADAGSHSGLIIPA